MSGTQNGYDPSTTGIWRLATPFPPLLKARIVPQLISIDALRRSKRLNPPSRPGP